MSTHRAIAVAAKGHFDEIQVLTGTTPGEAEVSILKVPYASLVAFNTYLVDRAYFVDRYPTSYPIALEAAATLPDNFVTAYYTLFNQLGLPAPSCFPVTSPPPLDTTPILIYGAGSTVGIYAIQLLSLAGYKKIIATASKRNPSAPPTRSIITVHLSSKTPRQLLLPAATARCYTVYAVDCISAESTRTLEIVGKLISPQGKVAILLPIKEGMSVTGGPDQEMYDEVRPEKTPFPQTTEPIYVRTFTYQQDEILKQTLMPKILPALHELGYVKPSRVRLINTGTFKDRINLNLGLELLRNNKVAERRWLLKFPYNNS